VHETLAVLADLFAPEFLMGGASGAAQLTFEDSVDAVFARQPRAAMVFEGDFVPGVADAQGELGVDVDVFPFPTDIRSEPGVVAGGDVAVLMRDSRGAHALVEFLASAGAAEVWARRGGFLSANEDVNLESYPDRRTRAIARQLLEAGEALRFDLSDLQPTAFGGTTGRGMFAILQQFLARPDDVAGTAARLEDAARIAERRGCRQ
jgi:ABC-type glycerol-3-phosphate transport system substrate-binding protein